MSGQVSVRRGFSLIEVLIAVLVLSLGLLGLAAVFPVVIAQQRDAVDRTRGAIVAETVQHLLTDAENLVSFEGLRRDYLFSMQNGSPSDVCRTGMDLNPEYMTFLWEPTWRWANSGGGHWTQDPLVNYQRYGDLFVGYGRTYTLECYDLESQPEQQYIVPVTGRLFPQPYSGEEPQYVWDIVPRRVFLGGHKSGLEIAVFIRRIDPRIAVPRGYTLSDVLTANRLPANQQRLPLGVDGQGRPTGTGAPVDGSGTYSLPQVAPVFVRSSEPNMLVLSGTASAQERQRWSAQVAVPGQIVVDNLGNVLNVVRVPELTGSELKVEVDRRYPDSQADYAAGVDPRGVKVEQIVYTPQKPVRVFTYRAEW